MQTYQCRCGNRIFFDNSLCLACGSALGFCPSCRQLAALESDDTGGERCANCQTALVRCANYAEHDVCNRCVALTTADEQPLCDCCRFNDTIPDLSVAGNLHKWYRLEAAKRRLFYELGQLGLPYGTASDGIAPPLAFDFKADVIPAQNLWRSMGKTEKVYTGHASGRITINIREADDVARETLRVDLGEAHRTLIGHFRHEIGHYYWDMLIQDRHESEFRAVFGDHTQPTYSEALEHYYQEGPPADWTRRFVSAYAAMHPWEDFAESFATYLDMISVLDTAHHMRLGGIADPLERSVSELVVRYQQLGIALNELNRSMGLLDIVPEVFAAPIVEKLGFIHATVQRGRAENGALRPTAAAAGPASSPYA